MDRHPPSPTPDALTPRQRHIAALIAEGLTNAEIGARLTVAPDTTAHHVEHILHRLGIGSRVKIATWAVAHGLAAPQRAHPAAATAPAASSRAARTARITA